MPRNPQNLKTFLKDHLVSLTPPPVQSADGPEGNLGSGLHLRLHPPPTSAHSACWQWAQDTDGYQAGSHTVVAYNRCDSLDDPTHDPPTALAPWNDFSTCNAGSPTTRCAGSKHALYKNKHVLQASHDTHARASVCQYRKHPRSGSVRFLLQEGKLLSYNLAQCLQ